MYLFEVFIKGSFAGKGIINNEAFITSLHIWLEKAGLSWCIIGVCSLWTLVYCVYGRRWDHL